VSCGLWVMGYGFWVAVRVLLGVRACVRRPQVYFGSKQVLEWLRWVWSRLE
jgi:hypothetical protein